LSLTHQHNMKTLSSFALLALLGLALCACAAQAATGSYQLSSDSPPQVSLDLASEPGARVFNATEMQPPTGRNDPTKLAIDVGDFSIDFYGEKITNFTLSFAGFIAFGQIYGNETEQPSFPLTDCPFPSRLSKTNDYAFYQGLAFAWSEYDWAEGGHVAYKVYPAGSCPYPEKAAQACLVVQATVLPYYEAEGTGLGNATAFIFSSGDFLVQVNSSPTGKWGNQRADSVGVIFGIQDVMKGQGVTYPGEQYCNVTATALGWEAVTNATTLYPGQTFGFYITAPCPSGQVIRPNGLGCYTKPSTSSAAQSTAAWIDSIVALFL
jgi:hypothetical protein